MRSEQLRIVCIFSGAWWKSPLEYGIYLNDTCLERTTLTGKILEPVKKIYGGSIQEGWNELKIRLESKRPDDILKGPDGSVVRNKYIDLKKILINDIGFEQSELMRLDGAWYKDIDPVTPIKNCIIHDQGTFVFKFKSPLCYWALQNMRTDL